MNLSTHFSLQEMTLSQTAIRNGIKNIPNAKQISNLKELCLNILEPLRTLVGKPIHVTSGFRNPIVNSLISGSSTSQHMKGEAADIHVEGLTTQELFDIIRTSDLPYDQLIQEFDSWVHVSFSAKTRRDTLVATKGLNNKTIMTRIA
ncbi:D-Ala-D-Ala carboxypeptidase family metallohydrolase [Spirosoma fluviale]|uniref:Peptidase M15 n=1 Tax=Spirosoma fluviale TaxID=1597977 RepID=A0A286F5P6_9BACT|nr:D-Ala-D-Ala carboxypeptidase family metallohydrolase [Spirosoma fluviale]SOD78426.1 Peptidase M15 [Spirosoma fluviale]